MVSQRQHQRDALAIRTDAKSSVAIQLASAQDFKNRGYVDADYVARILAANPAKFGPFLRKMVTKVDEEIEPKISPLKALATILDRSLSGNYNLIKASFTGRIFLCLIWI